MVLRSVFTWTIFFCFTSFLQHGQVFCLGGMSEGSVGSGKGLSGRTCLPRSSLLKLEVHGELRSEAGATSCRYRRGQGPAYFCVLGDSAADSSHCLADLCLCFGPRPWPCPPTLLGAHKHLASHRRMHFLQKMWLHGNLTGLLRTPWHTEHSKVQSGGLVKRLRSYPPLCKGQAKIRAWLGPGSDCIPKGKPQDGEMSYNESPQGERWVSIHSEGAV